MSPGKSSAKAGAPPAGMAPPKGASSDAAFSCPSGYAAKVRVQAGVSAWRYRYHGVFENLRISDTVAAGAYHSAEIPLVFGTTTRGELAVRKILLKKRNLSLKHEACLGRVCEKSRTRVEETWMADL